MNRQQRRAEARVVRATPQNHRQSGLTLLRQGRLGEAAAHLRRALDQAPKEAETHNNLGVTLQQLGQLNEAISSYRQAIACQPEFAGAHDNLGVALSAQGAYDSAIAAHRRAIELRPDAAPAHNHLGLALKQSGAVEAAIACYRRALELQPEFADALSNLGVALQSQGDLPGAIACYQRAIGLRPEFAVAYANLGRALAEQGSLEESGAAFETAAALAPRRGSYQRALVETGRVRPGTAAMSRLQSLAKDLASLPEPDRLETHFALGELYAGLGQPAEAFAHMLAGNRLHRARISYDETACLAQFAWMRKVFTRELLTQADGPGSRRPIFVVGMPRAGTTLVEQILASHKLVHGAGELPDLPHLVARLAPDAFADRATRAQLGADYLAGLSAQSVSAQHVVDKQPDNILYLGLIHLALPGARIIHVSRDPLDTCLSCFSKLFNAGAAYSYDLGELGRFYRAYQELMAHWRGVLPAEAMLEVRYEDIVTDLPGQVRRLLTYCELGWDAACLAFHQSSRAVRTASVAQVRRPIYANAVGRWRAYADLVEPLLGFTKN